MSQYYNVVQGDYLAKIAAKFGFVDYHVIWDHPKNASLKKKRVSPNVLLAGDILFIPDKVVKQAVRGTGQSHAFVVKSKTVLLRIVLKDANDELMKDADFILNFPGRTVAASASNGLIEEDVDINQSHVGTLTIQQPANSFDVQLGIKIGDLNPVSVPSGQMARLNNLGYFAGKLATGDLMDLNKPIPDVEQKRFESAVEEFQCDHMGTQAVDGKCGPKTQAKVTEVYGA